LFAAKRDANPVFHLAEALWMIAGRNNVDFLNLFVRDFGARFGEPDGTEHDAYGHRWRLGFGVDQIWACINRLKKNPDDRQAVIQMWDAEHRVDILSRANNGAYIETPVGFDDLLGEYRTRPCNTHIYLRINDGALDLTSMSRSHDILWGAYGSNAVTFSVLHEYLATALGRPLGRFYQFSNNYHIYTAELDRLSAREGEWLDDRYTLANFDVYPIVSNIIYFDKDVSKLLEFIETEIDPVNWVPVNLFLAQVALPMVQAYNLWRQKDHAAAVVTAHTIHHPDWRIATGEWLQRRINRHGVT